MNKNLELGTSECRIHESARESNAKAGSCNLKVSQGKLATSTSISCVEIRQLVGEDQGRSGRAPVIENNKQNVPKSNCIKLFSTQKTLSTFHSRTWLSGLMKCRIHQTFEVESREP